GEGRPARRAIGVAVSATGLARLQLPRATLDGFSYEFTGGIAEEHRSRLLGDVGESVPSGWDWGGPGTDAVDVALLLYADGEAAVDALADEQVASMKAHGVRMLRVLDSSPLVDREHFGFRDGVSQPLIEELSSVRSRDTVKAGEFLLGHPNGYGQFTRRPLVNPRADPASLLADDAEGSGLRDLGRNGTYLVFRQLGQRVGAFWGYCDAATCGPGGAPDREERIRLASKIVGRWPHGAPLTLSPDADDPALTNANDFGYFHEDREGLRCPVGSHVRRSHPRDSLDPEPGTARSVEVGNLHRLLRRGRQYGRFLPREEVLDATTREGWDDEPRGLHFVCLAGNLSRQFEFVQHSWIGNPRFGGLVDSPDPLLSTDPRGPRTFSVPADPVRRRYTGLPTFVTVHGGGYFFLPSVRALRYLAALVPD
ncbi:MAG: peroxidase, partial [Actinomycetota bacterium]|nr:peroxidase [Actinomycetota bacterium]